MTTTIFGRFAAPELLALGNPPALASKPFETLFQGTLADFLARMNAAGVPYEVETLETDPMVIGLQSGAYRDMLRLQLIDEMVSQSYLGSATGALLDHRCADYGIVRRVVSVADPTTGAPAVMEDDESLRRRGHLAWEALSTAGPAGAYVFHALDAHPEVFDAMAYGPESGLVQAGEVLVVIQSRAADGRPTRGMVDAVAARLDALVLVYGSVEFIQIEDGGADYAVGDAIIATGGGGSGFEAEVFSVDGSGAITAVKIISQGIGYIENPTLSVESDDGEGADLVASIRLVRQVGGQQSIRPLGALVTVFAAQPLLYSTTATLYVDPDGDREALRLAAIAKLEAYEESRKRIGFRVPKSGREAALALVSPSGIPVISDVDVVEADLVPSHVEVPVPSVNSVTVEIR